MCNLLDVHSLLRFLHQYYSLFSSISILKSLNIFKFLNFIKHFYASIWGPCPLVQTNPVHFPVSVTVNFISLFALGYVCMANRVPTRVQSSGL
jgi:hypothetical protein